MDTERLAVATGRLEAKDPHFSARSGIWRAQWIVLALGLAFAGVCFVAMPRSSLIVAEALLAVAFALVAAVRLAALAHVLRARRQPIASMAAAPRAGSDTSRTLPVYTVLVALYRETAVARQLVAALTALDYPADRLEIIVVCESDDPATRQALAAAGMPDHMQIVVVPDGLPRTKPRALSYAMTFAHGEFLVVYDAEDMPDPQQLRRALARFEAAGDRLGCLQAALSVNNAGASLLTRQYAIEYTILFDAILPALAAYRLPLPLGGTSNHFRRQALEHVGAWDPYNVTEDADLGLRLARFGYEVDVLASSTYEEAPPTWRGWVAQRTRWQKGWMQTYVVHMRQPWLLWRQLGARGFLSFQLVLGGGILSALAHPWFYAFFMLRTVTLASGTTPAEGASAWLWWFGLVTLMAATLVTAALAAVTLPHRNQSALLPHAFAAPLYWLPISWAAYRAIREWIHAPFYWAKTDHGGQPPSSAPVCT